MSVAIDDVRRVAALARLELSAAEEQQLAGELSKILDYMEKLNELDTAGVAPTSHAVSVAGTFRPDEAVAFDARDELLAQAPDLRDGYYRVPRVID